MLKISNLTKRYGDKVAAKDVSLEIQSGEIFGFIGHNGAGKTTTIKAVCGIISFDNGEIFVDGVDVTKNPIECKRKIAYIPDSPQLYDFYSGIKYLNFIADVYGVPSEERESQIKKYADAFELTKDLAQPIGAYSHGMKQKLAIISALVHKPKLLIMDEPFIGLDPKAAHTLKEIMREFCDGGGAIFFSNHMLEIVEKLCDKVAIITRGEIVAQGLTEDVRGDKSLEKIFLELTEEAEKAESIEEE